MILELRKKERIRRLDRAIGKALGTRTPVDLVWSSGFSLPDNGLLYVGGKGERYDSSQGGMPQLLPVSLHEQAKLVASAMDRSPGHEEWYQACKGGKAPG